MEETQVLNTEQVPTDGNNPKVAAERVKQLHDALIADEVMKDYVPNDFRRFVEVYKDPKNMNSLYDALSADDVFKDYIPDSKERMYDLYVLGKQKAEPTKEPSQSSVLQSPSRGGVEFGLNKTIKAEKPKTLATEAVQEAKVVPTSNIFADYENKQSYFSKVDKAKKEIVDNNNFDYNLPMTDEGKQIYLDATGKRFDYLKKEADVTQKKMSDALNPIIEKDITTEFLRKNDDGFLVPDSEKIDEYAKKVARKNNLPEDGFFKEVVYNEAQAMAAFKELEPKINERFNELITLTPSASDLFKEKSKEFWKGFTTDEVEQVELDKKVNSLSQVLSTKAKEEQNTVQYGLQEATNNIDNTFKEYQAQSLSQYNQLDAAYKAGQISYEQYQSSFNAIKQQSEEAYKAYSDERLKLFDEGQKALNQISNKYNAQLRRQSEELTNIAQNKVAAAAKKYEGQYAKDPVFDNKIKELYKKAYLEVANEKKKQILDYNKDRATELQIKYGQFGGLAAMTDRFLRSVDNAAGGSLKGLGTTLGINSLQVYGDFLQGSVTLPEARTKEIQDLFDPLNLAQVSGQLAGAMSPTIVAAAAAGVATKNLAAAYQIAATGAASFFAESADIAGRMYDETFSTTQSAAKANEASAKSWESQYKIMPLYALSGLPFISTAKTWMGTLPRVARVGLGASVEVLEEIPQDLSQNIAEENIRAGNDPYQDYWKKISENDYQRLKETSISVAPIALLGGAGQLSGKRQLTKTQELNQQAKAYAAQAKVNEIVGNMQGQWVSQMVYKKGDAFATATINSLFADGTIDQQTRDQLQENVLTSKKNFADAKTLGLTQSEGIVYDALTQTYAQKKAQFDKAIENGDEILSDNLNQEMTNIKNQTKEFAQNKKADFFIFEFADGSQKVVTNSNWSTDNTILDLIKNNEISVSAYSENGKNLLESIKPKIQQKEEQAQVINEGIDSFTDEAKDVILEEIKFLNEYITKYQKLVDEEKLVPTSRLKKFFGKREVSYIENALKSYQDDLKLLEENPIEFYKKKLDEYSKYEDSESNRQTIEYYQNTIDLLESNRITPTTETKTTENAIQEPSPTQEIPRTGEGGKNIPEGGQGVRPSEQGEETAQQGKEEVKLTALTDKNLASEILGIQYADRPTQAEIKRLSELQDEAERRGISDRLQEVSEAEVGSVVGGENPALKDVESTAKALEGLNTAPLEASLLNQIAGGRINGKNAKQVISEAYHAAKKDGSNPELVKAVEQSLQSTPQAEELTTKIKQDFDKIIKKLESVIATIESKAESENEVELNEVIQNADKLISSQEGTQVGTDAFADLANQFGEAAKEVVKTETKNETEKKENIPSDTKTDKGGEQSVVQEGLTEPTDKEIQVAAERLGIPLEPVTETAKTNGKVEPLTDAQLKLKEAKEKLSGTIDDVKKKFKDLYTSNVGIMFDPKVEAKKRFDFHMALRDLAVDAIRLGIVNIQQFSNVAGMQIDGALKLAWSEAQALLSGAPTVINTVDDMENRLIDIQASALQREKDENDKLKKSFKGKIIDAYFAAYDSIFGNHLPAKRLIDKATNNAIDNIPNYHSGANSISQARERGKLVDAARRVLRLQNLIPGAKSWAKSIYDEKGAPIFRGLNAAKKEMLNNIIEMRTIISIDKRFAEKKEADLLRLNTELASATDPKEITRINKEIKEVEDRPNVRHTAAENGESTSIYTAMAYLASLENTTDPQAKKTFEMLNDRATDYFAFMNELLLAKKNAGIISPELYNALINNEYSKRQFLEYVLSDGSGGSYRMGNKSYSLDGIKKIELGSEGAMVQNKEWLMKANIMSTARSVFSNNARVGLLDFVRLDPNNGLFREQKPSGVNNEGRPVFSESEVKKGEGQIFGREMEYIPTVDFTLDGVDYKKGIPISQEVYSDILNSPNGALLTTQIEAVGGKYFSIIAPIKFIETFEYPQTWLDPRAKKVLRFASLVGITSISAVTINPKFFLGNLPKDWLNALMHSEAYRGGFLPVKALKLGKDILSVSKDAATKGKLYRELMTYGGGFNTLSQEESPFEADFLNENKGLVKGAQKIYDGLSYLGSTSEIMTRLAIYSRTEKNLINKFIKENGGRQPNELQRVEFKRMAADASRSIMDYSKKGNVSDIAGTLYPFFNAGIRAVEGAKKSWADDPTGTALTYGQIAMLTAGLILYNLRPENEDDYEKIDEKIKLNNFIIMLPYSKIIDGKKERAYIKIPKTQSAQLLSNATEQAIRSQMGKKFNQEILFEAARNTAAIPELSPYSIPTVAAYGSLIHGYDHYHKRNVWNDRTPRSEGLKYVPTGRNKTPKSIVDLGEKVDVAPVNIELALKQIALSKDNIYFRAIDGGYRQIVADMTPEEKLIYDENVLEGIGNSFGSKFLDYTYDKPVDKKEIDKAVRLENDVKVKLDNRLKVITQLITDGKKTPAESEMAVRNLVDSAPNNLKYDIYKKYSDYLKNKKFIVTSNINVGGINFKKGALIDRSVYNKILALPNGKSIVNQIEANDDAAFLEGLKYIDAQNVKALQFVNEYQNKETEEEKNNFIKTAIEMKILPKEGLGFQIEGKVVDIGKGQVIPKYSSSKFEQEVSRLLREEKEKENQLNKQ